MTESNANQTTDLEPIEPRIVKLGEEFHPFNLPLKRWNGYSSHLAMNPAFVSKWVLQTGLLPEIPFLSVVQPSRPGEKSGRFSVEANKDHLGNLGMFEISPKGPDALPLLPMPPAVFGGSRWKGHYIFDEKVLEALARLRLQIVLPEGGYISIPNIYEERRTRIKYATGIQFDSFLKTGQDSPEKYAITIDSKDTGALSAIKAKIVIV